MKILYGIPSEGMGHATRSKVVIEHLMAQGHDVRMATSDRAFDLMQKAFPGKSFRIEGLHLAYDQGKLDKSASSKVLLKALPKQSRQARLEVECRAKTRLFNGQDRGQSQAALLQSLPHHQFFQLPRRQEEHGVGASHLAP